MISYNIFKRYDALVLVDSFYLMDHFSDLTVLNQSSRSSVFVSQAVNVIVQQCPIAGLLGNSVDGLENFLGMASVCLHMQSLLI